MGLFKRTMNTYFYQLLFYLNKEREISAKSPM
jgi:hypothetical protein